MLIWFNTVTPAARPWVPRRTRPVVSISAPPVIGWYPCSFRLGLIYCMGGKETLVTYHGYQAQAKPRDSHSLSARCAILQVRLSNRRWWESHARLYEYSAIIMHRWALAEAARGEVTTLRATASGRSMSVTDETALSEPQVHSASTGRRARAQLLRPPSPCVAFAHASIENAKQGRCNKPGCGRILTAACKVAQG